MKFELLLHDENDGKVMIQKEPKDIERHRSGNMGLPFKLSTYLLKATNRPIMAAGTHGAILLNHFLRNPAN